MAQNSNVPAEKSSPESSGRASPAPRAARRATEEGIYKADKALRRYGATIERALATWEVSPQEWADYIAFLGRLLKAMQTLPQDAPLLPHSDGVAYKLAQCLNPALPSGVHQKALEVYDYIFSAFGQTYVSDHLNEFLPGLSAVLSFGSLSIRPAFYSLYEEYVLHLPANDLRPVLKSLILSLLPGLEDETSEDFEQALRILDALRQLFAQPLSQKQNESGSEGFFWQCLFLAVISNPSRRQGALNYLSRRLPSFRAVSGANKELSPRLSDDAGRIVTPEPGLLIRCFVCGLSDSQLLIQRAFLDLLVVNMPLDSPVFQDLVGPSDLDLLVAAAAHVLLRREMSLNRRLWSWFLGPQPKADAMEDPQQLEKVPSTDALEASQFAYFNSFGKTSLERCILAMFKRNTQAASEKARPFRICLSLMDRWEIGGSIVPNIFRPAMESAYRYSNLASSQDVAEVMRSASLFFDGIEASLIWAEFISMLEGAIEQYRNADDLQMLKWIVSTFNVKDEEMLLVHIPYAATYLLALLQDAQSDLATQLAALEVVTILLDLVPDRAFIPTRKKSTLHGHSALVADVDSIKQRLKDFYSTSEQADAMPFGGSLLAEIAFQLSASLLSQSVVKNMEVMFCSTAFVLLTLNTKTSGSNIANKVKVSTAIYDILSSVRHNNERLAFPTLNAIVSLLSAVDLSPQRQAFVSKANIADLEPALIVQFWEYLSPRHPKYHVEAVKAIWQLHDSLAPQDCLQSSLTSLMRRAKMDGSLTCGTISDALQRFAVLWNHTIAVRASSTPGHLRRSSGATTGIAESKHSTYRQQVLVEPLMLVLDSLNEFYGEDADEVQAWLNNLPSLSNVFAIQLELLTESMKRIESTKSTERSALRRHRSDDLRQIEYLLGHFRDILRGGNEWTWQCLDGAPTSSKSTTPLVNLTEYCCQIVCDDTYSNSSLEKGAMDVLQLLLSSPPSAALTHLDIDARLIDRLAKWIYDNRSQGQDCLLRLLTLSLKIRASHDSAPDPRSETASGSRKASGTTTMPPHETPPPVSSRLTPPDQLLQCLQLGLSSLCSRSHLTQWQSLLSDLLDLFPDSMFSSLIPLVETLCAELSKAYDELQSIARAGRPIKTAESPETTTTILIDMLEELLSWAHEYGVDDSGVELTPRLPTQPRSLLGNVTTGIFKSDGPPTKSAQSNNRLNTVLAFQDAVRVSFKLWTWASHHANVKDLDKGSITTTSYNALRVRNRTRNLLEHIFSAEPLESLEVIMAIWCNAFDSTETVAALDLLHVTQAMKPKVVVAKTLDALYSRTNPAGLWISRQSCQTTTLTALDVTLFWSAYLESIEDDAMDEIWTDCMTLFKDVLVNPAPYRQALAAILSINCLVAEKVENTNFGEQRKMRRELGDIFIRLLAATFTATPPGALESSGSESSAVQRSFSLTVVLRHAVENAEALLETADRATSMVNSISTSLVAPVFHSRFFPSNVTSDFLALLFQVAKKAPTAKSWKKELADAFNESRLLLIPTRQMSLDWFPVLRQWCLHDKERIPDILSRLTPPSSAGIMFGVGASAARLEADRRTQLNLRRLCLLLLASEEDAFVANLRAIEERLVELFEASPSSSPSSAVKSDLFMVCRTLVLSVSATHLGPLWPLFNNTIQAALLLLMPGAAGNGSISNLSLLQACKLLDLLVATAPDDFQLHEWLYVTDTIDAVYQPSDWTPAALSDQIADSLNVEEHEDAATAVTPTAISSAAAGRRRLLLGNMGLPAKDDIKAMTQGDFARVVLLPFFSQLSIHAYEGFYSMELPDTEISRQNLLEDILDLSTIVE